MLSILLPCVSLTLIAHLRHRPLQVSNCHIQLVQLRVLHPDHAPQRVLLLCVEVDLNLHCVVLGLQVRVLFELLVETPDFLLVEKTLIFVLGRLMD